MPSKLPMHRRRSVSRPSTGGRKGALTTYRWRRFSERMRRRYPLCAAPVHRGPQAPSEMVHHILSRRAHPELTYVESNCCPVCRTCHGYIEALERLGTSTADLFDGWDQ
jgi:hypothetical protein